MSKGKFVQSLIDMAESAGLDMSDAARMQRAKDMGFDTERVFTHEGPDPQSIKEISQGGKYGGIFSLEGDRANYYDKSQDFLLRGDVADNRELLDFTNENYDDVLSWAKSKAPDASDDEIEEIIDYAVTGDNWPLEGSDSFDRMSELLGAYDTADMYAKMQKNRGELARSAGYGAVRQEDEFGSTVQLLPGNMVRRTDAAFDPSKKDSSNLLAGALPVGAAGVLAGGTFTPDQAQATTQESINNQSYLRLPINNNSTGSISAPVNSNLGLAGLAADYGDQYNNWRENNLAPGLDEVLPFGRLPTDVWRDQQYGVEVPIWEKLKAYAGAL